MEKADVKTEIRPKPPEGSCHFYIERKNRYCRFHPAKNANYCAEHAKLAGVDVGKERVFCPYNPKHTCYVNKLNHHKKVCPSRPREMPSYYSAGINSGDDAGEIVPDPKETVLTIPVEELETIIDRVNELYKEYIEGHISEEILSHSCMKEELENSTYGTAAFRHRKQQASLIGQMERLGLLTDHRCFLEMGAGKGQLSHWLHGAVEQKKDIGFLLIDRSHVRNKMDNLHKEEMIMERIRIDIEHLKLENVPSIEKNERSVVAFGKHLCGPATDLALRCVTETLPSTQSQGTDENCEDESHRKRLKSETRSLAGAVIALCCHHRCAWTPYVGKSFFKSCGLSARDFQVISSMSSWATCAWKGWSYQRKLEAKKLNDLENKNVKDTSRDQGSGDDLDIPKRVKDLVGNETIDDKTDSVKSETSTIENQKSEDITNVKDMDKSSEVEGKGENLEPEEEEEHTQDETVNNSRINTKLSQEEREVIGRKCKRLIDYGRVRYLQEHGLNSSLKTYIEEFYTPENVVLVASS